MAQVAESTVNRSNSRTVGRAFTILQVLSRIWRSQQCLLDFLSFFVSFRRGLFMLQYLLCRTIGRKSKESHDCCTQKRVNLNSSPVRFRLPGPLLEVLYACCSHGMLCCAVDCVHVQTLKKGKDVKPRVSGLAEWGMNGTTQDLDTICHLPLNIFISLARVGKEALLVDVSASTSFLLPREKLKTSFQNS